jgi:hypothetical protein
MVGSFGVINGEKDKVERQNEYGVDVAVYDGVFTYLGKE